MQLVVLLFLQPRLLQIHCACCTTQNKKKFGSCSMQGRKEFIPQLFYELSLDRLVPSDNFYRQVNQVLDLHFLY